MRLLCALLVLALVVPSAVATEFTSERNFQCLESTILEDGLYRDIDYGEYGRQFFYDSDTLSWVQVDANADPVEVTLTGDSQVLSFKASRPIDAVLTSEADGPVANVRVWHEGGSSGVIETSHDYIIAAYPCWSRTSLQEWDYPPEVPEYGGLLAVGAVFVLSLVAVAATRSR